MHVLNTYRAGIPIIPIIELIKSGKIDFFIGSTAANSVICGWIWQNLKLVHALMYVIITCKYEKDLIKNSCEKVATQFFPIISLWIFFQTLKGS